MKIKLLLAILLLYTTTGFAIEEMNPLTDSGVAQTLHCILGHIKNVSKNIFEVMQKVADTTWELDAYTEDEQEHDVQAIPLAETKIVLIPFLVRQAFSQEKCKNIKQIKN